MSYLRGVDAGITVTVTSIRKVDRNAGINVTIHGTLKLEIGNLAFMFLRCFS